MSNVYYDWKRMTNDFKRITKNDINFHLISFKIIFKQCKRKKRCTYVFLNSGPQKTSQNSQKKKEKTKAQKQSKCK